MKLLICTQAVDLDDPVLGFFHRWLTEFSKHCEAIHVVCLKRGRLDLPSNVFVHSLGKENGRSRIKYLFNFYRYVWKFRREYDAVFVHMNQEYVLLGGILWKLLRKRIVLWRNHKTGSRQTRIAASLADRVCYTSPSAYVATSKNAVKMPIGIDTGFFSPGSGSREQNSILFLGRLDPVKKVDVFVRALERLHENQVPFSATIVGDPTEQMSNYAHDVRNLASALALEGLVTMHPSVTNERARDLFRSHAIYCNLTPSGSFDKTIGEAMASGSLVVAVNDVLDGVLPEKLVPQSESDEAVAGALRTALQLSASEQQAIAKASRAYIEREHSLALLAKQLFGILAS